MADPPTTVHSVLLPTARLGELPGGAEAVRALMDASFSDFSDHDWDHALGGLHAAVVDDGELVAHAALVRRQLLVAGRTRRCGYVEAVAVAEPRRREGHAGRVMEALEALAPGYDVLMLGASETAVGFYLRRGWQVWRGPLSTLSPDGVVPTPDEDGHVYAFASTIDFTAAVTCDWRDGDVW